MRKGQTHPSTFLYKNMISEALIALLNDKKIGSITIMELCDKAQVARRTYYRHFNDKNEVIDYYVTKIMKSLALELRTASMQSKRSLVLKFFYFLKPYTQLFLVLNSNDLGEIVFTSYVKCVTTTLTFSDTSEQNMGINNSQNFQYDMAFMLGGLWSLLTVWMLNGCNKTPEELTDIVCA